MHVFRMRWLLTLCACISLISPAAANGDDVWSEKVLYSFAGRSDGAYPTAPLIVDQRGALYGTTPGGGLNGFGTVFKLSPPAIAGSSWTYSVLYFFHGGVDGAYPSSALIVDRSGALYATTSAGGNYQGGTVFKLTPPLRPTAAWTETVLASFPTVIDFGTAFPAQPQGLIADGSGALYGSTLRGGSAMNCDLYYNLTACGSVFKLTPPISGRSGWAETDLYSFQRSSYAAFPSIVAAGRGGALYGVSAYGAGADNSFHCAADYHGEGCGTVFELTPGPRAAAAWNLSILHSFKGYARIPNDGIIPLATPEIVSPAGLLVDRMGALYGTTPYGGGDCGVNGCAGLCPHEGCGTIFRFVPPAAGGSTWTEQVLHRFSGGVDGTNPVGPLIADEFGALYGTTSAGGTAACSCGTVFRLVGGGPTEIKSTLYTFHGIDGALPIGGLAMFRRVLYGTTKDGGASNHGTIFALSRRCN